MDDDEDIVPVENATVFRVAFTGMTPEEAEEYMAEMMPDDEDVTWSRVS